MERGMNHILLQSHVLFQAAVIAGSAWWVATMLRRAPADFRELRELGQPSERAPILATWCLTGVLLSVSVRMVVGIVAPAWRALS